MKLFTHNILCCPKPKCFGYPMIIDPTNVIHNLKETFDVGFMHRIMEIIDYSVFRQACESVGILDVPESLPSLTKVLDLENLLRSMHKILLGTRIIDGKLICPKCISTFVISNG